MSKPTEFKRPDLVRDLAQLKWPTYPVRVCQSLHYCEYCCRDITLGQTYRDGGYRRRAHETCHQKAEGHG